MRFFEAQAQARSKTTMLLLLFLALVVVLSFVNAMIVGFSVKGWEAHFWPIFALTGLFFVGSAAIEYANSKDGSRVATLMGGELIQLPTSDPDKKKLYNVVEEMAIASGIRVPKIYVLEGETSINAFTAGIPPHDTVIAVTRGAIENLNREELQAVIGHEFSHIFHGDVGLNMQLTGVVSGFFVFIRMARVLSGGGRRQAGRRAQGGVPTLSLAFFLIGSLGYVFGKLIQSFISRQREYLADASSAQYTRNPEALARALGKIHLHSGSLISADHKDVISHFFFASATKGFFTQILATHPPIEKRIQQLIPKIPLQSFYQDLERKMVSASQPSTLEETTAKTSAAKPIESMGASKEFIFAALLSTQAVPLQQRLHSALEPQEQAHVGDLLKQLSSKALSLNPSLQKTLGILAHSPEDEKKSLVESLKKVFEMDQKIQWIEGLLYIVVVSELWYRPQGQEKSTSQSAETLISKWLSWACQEKSEEEKQKLRQTLVKEFNFDFRWSTHAMTWNEIEQDYSQFMLRSLAVRKRAYQILDKSSQDAQQSLLLKMTLRV